MLQKPIKPPRVLCRPRAALVVGKLRQFLAPSLQGCGRRPNSRQQKPHRWVWAGGNGPWFQWQFLSNVWAHDPCHLGGAVHALEPGSRHSSSGSPSSCSPSVPPWEGRCLFPTQPWGRLFLRDGHPCRWLKWTWAGLRCPGAGCGCSWQWGRTSASSSPAGTDRSSWFPFHFFHGETLILWEEDVARLITPCLPCLLTTQCPAFPSLLVPARGAPPPCPPTTRGHPWAARGTGVTSAASGCHEGDISLGTKPDFFLFGRCLPGEVCLFPRRCLFWFGFVWLYFSFC